MTGSFLDILPPEAQQVLGGISVLVIASGVVVWAAGVKIARFSVAMLLGVAIAVLGAWLLPKFMGITIATGGILGFVIGAMAGALGFRVLQGLILAVCLGLAVGGIYYRWHIAPELAAPPTGQAAAEVPASDLLIRTDRLGAGGSTTAPTKTGHAVVSVSDGIAAVNNGIEAVGHSLLDRWSAIPAVHQKRLLIVSISAAGIALLIAFGFPRPTTWVISALLGSLMILSGINALLHVYAPQYEGYLPVSMRSRYLTLAIVMLIGMGIQYRFFPRKKARAKAAPPADPAPVAAVPTT